MKTLQSTLILDELKPLFKEFKLGLEKESQRITPTGSLSKTDHPKALGSRDNHPYIQTDFSETQIELITPVFDTNKKTLQFLGALHEVTLRSMIEDERLWPLSMPPVLPEHDRDIMIAKLSDQGDINYRRYLAKVYGKRKQMVSGIHYNFEYGETFITTLFDKQEEYTSRKEFQTELYLKASSLYLRYRWLITYLFGASPYAEPGYFTTEEPEQPVRSIRNSRYGYTNRPEISVSYATLASYVSDLEQLVDNGDLIEAKEFYSSVRLRGCDELQGLLDKGICYIELRNLDLNPFAPYGITEETLDFLHFFMMTLLWLDEEGVSRDEHIEIGNRLNDEVSLEHPLSQTSQQEEGEWLLGQMETLSQHIQLPASYLASLEKAKTQLVYPELTLSGQIVKQVEAGQSNHEIGVAYGELFYETAYDKPYQLEGYRHMELSTQLMLFDAIQRGIKTEVLDEHDQFLQLSYQGQVEYVKNANMTSKDSYVVPLLMENKTVTKKILHRQGFRVPLGKEFGTIAEALESYDLFSGKGIVIKPKSTNYGLGISIFKDGASREDYKLALEFAFKEDQAVLVEEFLPGTEYRFFVLDGQTKAIMLRTPANVVGDGEHTIEELVAEKNKDNLRGTHHRSPLELIKLGEIEKLMLKEQGYQITSIPEEGTRVFLRENSNVSTGGDSLDVTDDMDESYKRIAEEAVVALGAVVCGIDLIIPDKDKPGKKDDMSYGIIEANFNPAMHMHIYPYAGKGRRLTQDVLDLLFPRSKDK